MMLAATPVRCRTARRAAFTLLEVLVVVAILVILAGVASISIFKYLEDAKVGRAKMDMKTIEQAYMKYYSEKFEWPQDISQIYSSLEQGQAGTIDPWGNTYTVEIAVYQAEDGTEKQRPVVHCQPPGGKPPIQVPER
jgi:general secretion pathway protein G